MITVSIIIKFQSVALTCAFLLSIVELLFFCRCQLHLKLHNSIQALFPALNLNRVQLQKDVSAGYHAANMMGFIFICNSKHILELHIVSEDVCLHDIRKCRANERLKQDLAQAKDFLSSKQIPGWRISLRIPVSIWVGAHLRGSHITPFCGSEACGGEFM